MFTARILQNVFSRIKYLLLKLISNEQDNFISCCTISDNILLVKESLRKSLFDKSSSRGGLVNKVCNRPFIQSILCYYDCSENDILVNGMMWKARICTSQYLTNGSPSTLCPQQVWAMGGNRFWNLARMLKKARACGNSLVFISSLQDKLLLTFYMLMMVSVY